MKKCLSVLLFSVIFLFALSAELRTALVIGNAAYRSASLRNPANDARDMSAALQNLGFSVTTLIDADNQKMYQAIRDFGKDLARGGMGLFYYAGHGMQVDGTNYLIPIGANIQAEDEVRFNSIDANLVLSKMESAGNDVNIVILDACRDNPFARSFRSSSRGLAIVEAPTGSLVIYATAPGSVAADGTGKNGIFTESLLQHIRTPGIDVETMLRNVRKEVLQKTERKQTPWSSSSLTGSFFFAGRRGATEARASEERKPTITIEKAYGSLTVEAKTEGQLYLDGKSMASIPVGQTAKLSDLETGGHTLEMRYEDGKKESKRVTVQKERTVQVSFSYTKRTVVPEGFVLVKAGTFRMGSTDGDDDEKPVHSVTIGKSFYMSKYEVTQRQWREVMGSNPSRFKGDSLPVEQVSWYDAVEYCNRLSRKEGLTPAYRIDGKNAAWNLSANGYRLPTEAEWEYAAGGGNKSRGYKYSGSNSAGDVGWYRDNSSSKTHPVGGKQPNELGLYDMSGNVYEWCWDWKGSYSSSSQTDPQGPSSGSRRVRRGGSWYYFALGLRAAHRRHRPPSYSYDYLGFRPLRTAD